MTRGQQECGKLLSYLLGSGLCQVLHRLGWSLCAVSASESLMDTVASTQY